MTNSPNTTGENTSVGIPIVSYASRTLEFQYSPYSNIIFDFTPDQIIDPAVLGDLMFDVNVLPIDSLEEADKVRMSTPMTSDSTEILRALRNGSLD